MISRLIPLYFSVFSPLFFSLSLCFLLAHFSLLPSHSIPLKQLIHGIVNLSPETFALTAQHRDPLAGDLLRLASQRGHADDVIGLLLLRLVARNDINGTATRSIPAQQAGRGSPGEASQQLDAELLLAEQAGPGALQEALWLAVAGGHAAAAAVLAEAGADLEARTQDGNTALLEAVRQIEREEWRPKKHQSDSLCIANVPRAHGCFVHSCV